MRLEGSCHCGSIQFSCETHYPLPYQRCYCAICRKTSGGGGYLIHIEAEAATLEVKGREHLRVYRPMKEGGGKPVRSRQERHFCALCGSHLWSYHPNWPELLHPVASAIDTPLPEAPENVHVMIGAKPSWVPVEGKPGDERFEKYPEQSHADWHIANGYQVD